jgi:hypothetical protein
MQLMQLHGGDPDNVTFQQTFHHSVGTVGRLTREAGATADRLAQDDLMNPVGKRRLQSEAPGALRKVTDYELNQMDIAIDLLEIRNTNALLRHDESHDSQIAIELQNYVANLKREDAAMVLVQLATNTRFATAMAGSLGESLAARFGTAPASLRRAAIQSLSKNGTPMQLWAAKGLAGIPAARRVASLSRAHRDAAIERLSQGLPRHLTQ